MTDPEPAKQKPQKPERTCPWNAQFSSSGRPYFYNKETMVSQWDLPSDYTPEEGIDIINGSPCRSDPNRKRYAPVPMFPPFLPRDPKLARLDPLVLLQCPTDVKADDGKTKKSGQKSDLAPQVPKPGGPSQTAAADSSTRSITLSSKPLPPALSASARAAAAAVRAAAPFRAAAPVNPVVTPAARSSTSGPDSTAEVSDPVDELPRDVASVQDTK